MLPMGPTNAWWSSCEGDKYTGCRHGCLSISVGSFLSLRSLFFLAPLSPCISIFDYCVGYLYASIPNFGTLASSKHNLPNMLTHLSSLVKILFEDIQTWIPPQRVDDSQTTIRPDWNDNEVSKISWPIIICIISISILWRTPVSHMFDICLTE